MQPMDSAGQPTTPQDLGGYLREVRQHRGLGLREAAAEIGIDAGHLSKLERNVGVPPGGDLILRLARFYAVPVDHLLSRARSRTAATVAADKEIAREIAAFYRLAANRTRQERLQMLLAALERLHLPPEEKRRWELELKELAEPGPELLRLGTGAAWMFGDRYAPRRLRAATIEAQADQALADAFGSIEDYEPPTPIDRIVELGSDRISIEVLEIGDPRGALRPDGTPAVLGMTRFGVDGRPIIAIHEYLLVPRDAVARRRCNFTLGHEYYHAIEHLPRMKHHSDSAALRRHAECSSRRLPRRLSTPEDWREWQANTFAGAILMPAGALRQAFEKTFGVDAIRGGSQDVNNLAESLGRQPAIRKDGRNISLAELFDVNPQAMAIRLQALDLVCPGHPMSA